MRAQSELPDGHLSYRLKRPLRDGTLALVLSPSELIRRLCTLVPPPRKHLVRFHGVFGPCSGWRRLVVPEPPPSATELPRCSAAPSPPVPVPAPEPGAPAEAETRRSCASGFRWAELLRRVFAWAHYLSELDRSAGL